MKSIFSFGSATALLAATSVVADYAGAGCFTSTTGLTMNSTYTWNSLGWCGDACTAAQSPVFAMNGKDCYCGDLMPPASTKTDDGTCAFICPGWKTNICGGAGAYSVYLTGLTAAAPKNAPAAASDGASSSTQSKTATSTMQTSTVPTKASVVTVGGQTVVVTAVGETNSATSTAKPSSGGPSKAGIAAGVVVGVVAIAAILGGLFLFMRSRKRKEIEEEYKRNAAVNSFVNAGKPPPSSSSSFADMRLDPAVMAQRRMSDGSIADNQDYSRRILKVTNA